MRDEILSVGANARMREIIRERRGFMNSFFHLTHLKVACLIHVAWDPAMGKSLGVHKE